MLYVFCYDIPSNRRRRKAANVLLDFGGRFQRSCFECDLPTEARLKELVRLLWAELDPAEDTVRIYRVCAECRPQARTLGIGTIPPPLPKTLLL
jgi:CRISPR-associated protein Cas2